MYSRPVMARAKRAIVMAASVPLDVKRTISMCGMRSAIASANSTSRSVGMPKLVPSCIARDTASNTTSGACPSTSGPHDRM